MGCPVACTFFSDVNLQLNVDWPLMPAGAAGKNAAGRVALSGVTAGKYNDVCSMICRGCRRAAVEDELQGEARDAW